MMSDASLLVPCATVEAQCAEVKGAGVGAITAVGLLQPVPSRACVPHVCCQVPKQLHACMVSHRQITVSESV